MIYNNKRWPIPFTVTRSRLALSIEVTKIETATDVSLFPREDASIRFTIREKDGRRVPLEKPALTFLSLVGANKNKVQAQYGKATILDESGNEITTGFELGPGQTREFQLRVADLTGPGEFNGNLRLSTADAEPVDQPITILRKKSGWIAGFLIFVGVLLSYLLRRYATTARPRLVRQRRTLGLMSDIDELDRTAGELTEGERDVLKELRKRLSTLYEDIAMAMDNKADETLEEINRKVNIFSSWVQERRRVDSLHPTELQKDFRTELEKVRTYMLKQQATSEDAADVARILAGIAPNMATKVKDDLEQRLKSFSAEINAHRLATKSDAVRARLGTEVDPKITAAQESLIDRLDVARAAYNEARLAYARILTDELADNIPSTAPLGFDAPDWDKLRSQTMEIINQARLAADADNATKLYQVAFTNYLRNLAWKLQSAIEQLRGNIPTDSSISPENKSAYDQTLLSLKQKLGDALTKVDAGKLSEAAADYEAAKDELLTLNQQLPAGTSMGVAAGASAATSADSGTAGSVPGAFELPFLGAILGRGRGPLPSFSELTKRLSIFDLLVTLVVLLVAVFFGLKLLWSDTPTWGGWNDYLTAILWGLGLHQVSGVATQGVAGIAAKLSPTST